MHLAIHQQAAVEVGGDHRGGAGEEALGVVLGGSWWLWEWLGEMGEGYWHIWTEYF